MTDDETSSRAARSVCEMSKSVRHFRSVAPGFSLRVISPAIRWARSSLTVDVIAASQCGVAYCETGRSAQKRIETEVRQVTYQRSRRPVIESAFASTRDRVGFEPVEFEVEFAGAFVVDRHEGDVDLADALGGVGVDRHLGNLPERPTGDDALPAVDRFGHDDQRGGDAVV